MLQEAGYSIEFICRDTSLEDRKESFNRFAYGNAKVLLTTDMLSRGIDIPQLKIVVNVDIPYAANRTDPCFKLFLSRCSRAGRLGRSGIVFTLIDSQESFNSYRRIASYFGFSVKSVKQ